MNESKPLARYSDAELQEFKQLILEKIDVAKQNYDHLMGTIQKDESSPSMIAIEDGSVTMSKE